MTKRSFTSHHGKLVAAALTGSWRADPPPGELSAAELDEIAPILKTSGAAALAWWRLTRTGQTESAEPFFPAYKEQTLQAAVHDDDIALVYRRLHEANLDALVVKGWAVARLYPEPGLRHYGDIDLCIRARDYASVTELLATGNTSEIWIDLHQGVTALDYGTEADLFARSVLVPCGDVSVRVPCLEDHLRILCLHLLRHGACDVALALETRAPDFDWQLFFGHDARRADWLACVLGLAHNLLGARIDDTPAAARAETLPRWLTHGVVRRWGRWFNSDYRDEAPHSLRRHAREPMRILEDLYFRCDPIRATVEMGGAFSRLPRLPYQLAALLRRTPELPNRVLGKTPASS